MAFFWNNSFDKFSDYDAGLEVIKIYMNEAEISADINEIVSAYMARSKFAKSQIEGLGLGIKMAEVSRSRVEDAMEELAKYTSKRFPDDIQEFRRVIQGEAINPNYFSFDAIKMIGGGSVTDLIVGAGNLTNNAYNSTGTLGKSASNALSIPKYLAIGAVAVSVIYVLSTMKWGVKEVKNGVKGIMRK